MNSAPNEKLAGQPVGRRVRIAGFSLEPSVFQRLLEMGLTVGTECTVVRYAPLGDPMEIRVRGEATQPADWFNRLYPRPSTK